MVLFHESSIITVSFLYHDRLLGPWHWPRRPRDSDHDIRLLGMTHLLGVDNILISLTGCDQVCTAPNGSLFGLQSTTCSIIQGSGIGPTLWIIMETHLHPLLQVNVMFTYARGTSLLVTEHTDVSLAVEFLHIETW